MSITMPAVPCLLDSKPPLLMSYVPAWIIALSSAIINGGQKNDPDCNHVGLGILGDVILYRKLNSKDLEHFPLLRNVKEIWVSYEVSSD